MRASFTVSGRLRRAIVRSRLVWAVDSLSSLMGGAALPALPFEVMEARRVSESGRDEESSGSADPVGLWIIFVVACFANEDLSVASETRKMRPLKGLLLSATAAFASSALLNTTKQVPKNLPAAFLIVRTFSTVPY